MGKVKIIADTACDIDIELFRQYDIEIMFFPINDGKNEYNEYGEISTDEFFNNMKNGTVYRTSQINTQLLKEKFEACIKEDTPVIYATLSSGISGTYENSKLIEQQLLEEYKDAKIFVGDTRSAAGGEGMFLLRLAMMAKDNASFEEIKEAFDYYQIHQEHLWTITNFDYLLRGGRISKAKAVIGGALNIRPIMDVNRKTGTLEPVDKARGEKNLMKKMVEQAIKNSGGTFDKEQTIVIGYGQNMKLHDDLKAEVIKTLGVPEENILSWQLGFVVGSHIGPDYTGLYFLSKPRKNEYDFLI